MRLLWPPSVPTWMGCSSPLNWPPLASNISHRTRYSPAWSRVSPSSQEARTICLSGSRRCVGRLPGAMTCSHPRNKSSSATSWSLWMAGVWKRPRQSAWRAGDLAADMLEGMASLVDKSLLRQEEQAAGETRFWMLQTLREFGLEQLATNGELEATCQAHAEYSLRLAEELQPSLQANEQGRSMARLEQEHENLRAALDCLVAPARGGGEYNQHEAYRGA